MSVLNDYETAVVLVGSTREALKTRHRLDLTSGMITPHDEKKLLVRMNEYLETPRIARTLMEAVEKFEARRGPSA